MNVLLVNTYDSGGGAARAAYQLHQGFHKIGIASQMLVQTKRTDNQTIIPQKAKLNQKIAQFIPNLTTLPLPLYRQREKLLFSPQWFPDRLVSQVTQIAPDIINLHWLCWGFVQIETLPKFKKPLVWTFHDMWPFTGGCHYSSKCDRYQESCGTCPQLHSNNNRDLSHWVCERKAKAWRNLNLTIVTPSLWLAKCVSSSSLFKDQRVEVIPHGLDIQRYKPTDKKVAREILNLPQDKQLVSFGSVSPTSDPRKGFHLLQPALQSLIQAGWQDKIELVIFGSSKQKDTVELGLKCHYIGRLNDDISLALVYTATDVFVAPSVQEVFGLTVMEALACGTPSIGFNIGGIPDIIDHQSNGYLARPFEIEDLAQGIAWILENPERYKKLSNNAREKAKQEFTQELQAQRYSSLFEEILQK